MTSAAVTSPDLFDLISAIDEVCRTRGFELAISEELAHELLTMRTAQAALMSLLDMNTRIQACFNNYQADLISEGAPGGRTPALRESWLRFEAASTAFRHRVETTADEVDRQRGAFYAWLRQLHGLVEQGVV